MPESEACGVGRNKASTLRPLPGILPSQFVTSLLMQLHFAQSSSQKRSRASGMNGALDNSPELSINL